MRELGMCIGSYENEEKQREITSLIKQAGFNACFTGYERDDAAARMACEVAQKMGLRIDSIHAPFDGINHMWLPGEEGDEILSRLIKSIDVCADYGINQAVVHLSSGWNSPQVNDLGTARYDQLVNHAIKKGVKVAFENLRKLANVAYAMERYSNNSEVGFCWDSGHELCYTKQVEFLPIFGDRLCCVHLHDNLGILSGDQHMLPFDGKRDWQRAAALLKSTGYQGPIMLENGHDPRFYSDLSYEQFLERAYNSAVKIRQLMGE